MISRPERMRHLQVGEQLRDGFGLAVESVRRLVEAVRVGELPRALGEG